MKNRTLALVTVLLLFSSLLFGCRGKAALPACLVTGDVENLVSLADLPRTYYTRIPGEKGSAIPLAKLVEASAPLDSNFSVLLLGVDGLFARLAGDELEGCYIVNRGGTWNTVAKEHPVNAGIKDLREIIIVAEGDDLDLGVNIISQTENICRLTPGKMALGETICYPYLDGETKIEGGYGISLYKQKKVIPLTALTEEEIRSVLVMGKEGEYEFLIGFGYLELNKNEINYLLPKDRFSIRNIAGVIINPPVQSVLDTYADSIHYLNLGEKVMVIYIDGLGYHQYEHARDLGCIPNLAALGTAGRVNTIYKPVTNAGFAALVTGQPPAVNGICARESREPKVDTIFDWLEARGKNHVLIEGNGSVLKLNTNTVYSADLNNDGSNDDEVFNNALTELKKSPDFIMVHFHGVDDAGHNYGDCDERTMAVLQMVDLYIRVLVEEWEGRVIITSDHGMHSLDDEGSHGSFRYEDMFVPYFRK